MIYFDCDYSQGAHPKILERLTSTNLEQTPGYGCDPYCDQARALIRELCGAPAADVHFLVGGTQVNATFLNAALRGHQGVLSAAAGHIHCHETGAPEAGGHKVLALPTGPEGKLSAAQVEEQCAAHCQGSPPPEHMVQPKVVYISHPTENGALYSLAELEALRAVCGRWGLYLYVDGARLGYGLTAPGTDVDLPALARLCDGFTIGGTKCGALFGEALVITNPDAGQDFRYYIKQGGGMLAKGRLLGLQFLALLEDGLYFTICRQANALADRLAEACREAGLPEYAPSATNQRFFLFTQEQMARLSDKYAFSLWESPPEGPAAYRLCTSWGHFPTGRGGAGGGYSGPEAPVSLEQQAPSSQNQKLRRDPWSLLSFFACRRAMAAALLEPR